MQVLDTQGGQVLWVGLSDTGFVTYSDGGKTRDSWFGYPVAAWTDLSLLLRPSTGTYTLSADGLPVGSGRLTPGSAIPGRISIASSPAGGTFAVDDVTVSPACCPC